MAKYSPQDVQNREYFSTNLNKLMTQKGIRQIDLHNDLEIPKSTITGYVKGRSLPTAGNLQKLADYLGVRKSSLDLRFINQPTPTSTTLQAINSVSERLNEPRRLNVLTYSQTQLDEQEKAQREVTDNIVDLDEYRERTTRTVDGVVSAGGGISQDDNLGLEVSFYADSIPKPSDYDTIALVAGHSMEPTIKNGDYLFIKATSQVNYNKIGIFQVDGENYVKKQKTSYLESLNPDYPDIPLDENNTIRTIGEVVTVYSER